MPGHGDASDASGKNETADSHVEIVNDSDAGSPAVDAQTRIESVASTNVTLHVRITEVAGSHAPLLVAINGGPGLSHHVMEPFEALASERLRVATYDHRGVGGSSAPPFLDYSLASYVADLDAIRTHFGAEQLILLGHSFGGLIAQSFLAAHPDRVQAAILVSSAPPYYADLQAASTRFSAHVSDLVRMGLIDLPVPATCDGQASELLPAYFSDPEMVPPPAFGSSTCSSVVMNSTLASLGAYDLRDELAEVTIPVIVLFGQDDGFGLDMAQDVKSAFQAADPSLEIYPDCGHFPWFEACAPDFQNDLEEFLDEVTE